MPDLNLAVIGNSAIAALLDRRGSISWCCFPRLDADPLFCSLLQAEDEPEPSCWAIELEDLASVEQRYLDNTAVVVTELTDSRGARLRITDFAPRFKHYDRLFRPPTLVRRVEPLAGHPRIRVVLRPRFGYGSERPEVTPGSNHLRFGGREQAVRLTTNAPLAYVAGGRPFLLLRPLTFLLGPDEPLRAPLEETAREWQERTEAYWREWTRYLSLPFEWQEAVIRAAITLKLCSFEETGAIVAALTTSIPEAAGSARNWDYRFCWLRDAYFVVHALNRLGATRTMEEYIGYVLDVAALDPGGPLRPVYAIVPGEPLTESTAPALAGYRGMGPVRIGNQAGEQVQNDGYGNVVLAAAQMFFDRRLPQQGNGHLFARLEELGERAYAVALTPDAGLWELRGTTRVHTFSAVMCWAACDRLARIAAVLGKDDRASAWRTRARSLRDEILVRASDPETGGLAASFGGQEQDASLLLLHELGFLAADDPRFAATVSAIERELRRGDMLYRYVVEDDFGRPETAFTVCTFWYVDALAALGRRDEARAIFERLLARRNHLGLLSEDVDFEHGDLWGNFPQTYSMVGLIGSAMRLSKSWEDAFWRGSS